MAIFSDETMSWNLAGNYRDLGDHLALSDDDSIRFVALDPNGRQNWLFLRESGIIGYNIDGPFDKAKQIERMSMAYMQNRAREDGQTLAYSSTLMGATTKAIISPQTSHDKVGVLNPFTTYASSPFPFKHASVKRSSLDVSTPRLPTRHLLCL